MKIFKAIGFACLIFSMISCSDKNNDPNPEEPLSGLLKEIKYFEEIDNINFRTTTFYYNSDGTLHYLLDIYFSNNSDDYDSIGFEYDNQKRIINYSRVEIRKDGVEDRSNEYKYIYKDSDTKADSSYQYVNGIINDDYSTAYSYSGTVDSIRVIRKSGSFGFEWQFDRIFTNGNLVKETVYFSDGSISRVEVYEYDTFENPFKGQPFGEIEFGSGEQVPPFNAGEKGYPNNVIKITNSNEEDTISYEYKNGIVTKSFYFDDNLEDVAKVEYTYY